MKNQFVQYEMSVKLKELGFNEKCFDVYSDVKSVGMFRNSPRDRTPKILWQQAFDFFMEKYGYISSVTFSKNIFRFQYGFMGGATNLFMTEYSTYEEARLECLKKLIEIVENKKG